MAIYGILKFKKIRKYTYVRKNVVPLQVLTKTREDICKNIFIQIKTELSSDILKNIFNRIETDVQNNELR